MVPDGLLCPQAKFLSEALVLTFYFLSCSIKHWLRISRLKISLFSLKIYRGLSILAKTQFMTLPLLLSGYVFSLKNLSNYKFLKLYL